MNMVMNTVFSRDCVDLNKDESLILGANNSSFKDTTVYGMYK